MITTRNEPQQQTLRCETCEHFVGKMKNFFGMDQPFCKNPKIIEANKNKPEAGGIISPSHYRIEDHRIMKGNLYFQPMSEFQVQTIRILGCFSHSANTSAQARIDAVVAILQRWKDCQMVDLTDGSWYSEVSVEKLDEAIALLKEGGGK